jgi:hypothetical protein
MTITGYNAIKVALAVLGVASMALLATRSDAEVRIVRDFRVVGPLFRRDDGG